MNNNPHSLSRRTLLLTLGAAALCAPVWAESDGSLQLGQTCPNFSLTDQTGKSVELRSFKGKVVVVTFLYTSCPYPEKCPMLAATLKKLRDTLTQVTELRDRFQLLSITLDPKRDTPEALRAYAHGMDANTDNWTFLTGKPGVITKVAALFGMVYYTDKGVIDHNIRTGVLDSQQKLRVMLSGNEWKPGELASRIRDLANP